jgi:hypothetical protein
MEYQVPQFIEVEDKIVGRLTLKQFIYLAGTVGLCVVFFSYAPIILAGILSAPVIGLGAALAFYKVNGKPFIEILEAGFQYYTREKLLLWKQPALSEEERSATATLKATVPATRPRTAPKLTRGKLAELAWSLDVRSSMDNAPGLES